MALAPQPPTPDDDPAMPTSPAVLALVGAGPRATGLLERLGANAPELWNTGDTGNIGRPLRIELIDPHPPGPGRVWRHAQSPLLRMNSMAEDVTVFTDETSEVEGPVRPGPSLAEWAAHPERHAPYRPPADAAVRAELRALAPTDFATRRVQGAYLEWAFRRALHTLPPHFTVRTHRTAVTALTGPADGTQRLHLASGAAPVEADLVVLAQGHLSATPGPEHAALADFARRHELTYVPPEFSADADLSGVRPGEPVLLRGFGLAFVDLMALLTEGRGGTYAEGPDGALDYRPSGREPVLYVGSRRGVPYRCKPGYQLQVERAPLPRYFGPAQTDALASAATRAGNRTRLDLRREVWPLMAKEIGYGYYHELFHAHPERTALPWRDFLAAYDRLDWYGPELAELTARAVPAPADRLDFEGLDRPLEGRVFADRAAFEAHLARHVGADIARRSDPAYSADLGAFLALLSVYGQLPRLAASGALSADSVAHQLDGWWHGFFSYFASGPPAFRLRELLALSRAGIVRGLGAGLEIAADEGTGTFRATSTSVPGHPVTARALIEAYLPRPTLERTADPLLRALHRSGELAEETVTDPAAALRTGLLVTAPEDARLHASRLGGPHPRRFALGAPTNGRAVAAFARPRTNAPAFRRNDTLARTLLRALSGGGPSVRPAREAAPASA
ncbi:FAD/NAD(P)-binding protein [Streptomyces sp. NPDC048172]|uniref:FAD/NAD(P)-binding protein n=1 Tax=Streptomyces sp. NPDC048172 TaxID=3365505 RepID=UPI003716A224